MRRLLVLLLLLVPVGSASADDPWLTFSFSPDPTRLQEPVGSADVGADGTQIRAWTRIVPNVIVESDVIARSGSGPPVVLGRTRQQNAVSVFAGWVA